MQVLVAVDDSDAAGEVVAAVVPWLRGLDTTVDLLTVLDASGLHAAWTRTRSEAVEEASAERRGVLEGLAHLHLADLPHRVLVEIGERDEKASDAILRVAADVNAEMIVMGTHGRTGVRRALIGSVAEAVIRHAHVPILVIPTRAADRP